MAKKPLKLSGETITSLRRTLATLPEKPRTHYTARESVAELAAEIRHAIRNLGYSLADIAKIYADHGHAISPSTLASALRALERQASKQDAPARSRRRKPRTIPEADIPDAHQEAIAAVNAAFDAPEPEWDSFAQAGRRE